MQEANEQVVETAAKQPAQDAPQVEVAANAQTEPQAKPKEAKENPLQKRFDELTRRAHEAERERTYWQEVANKKAEPATEKPKKGDFGTDDDYFEALIDWKAEQAARKGVADLRNEQAEQSQRVAVGVKAQAFAERAKAAKATLPDFDEVMGSADAPISASMRDAIIESDMGPQLAYHLAKNPDVLERLLGLSATSQARELGKIEATLTREKEPVKTSKAPDPITPLRGGSGQFQKDPANMTEAEWESWRFKRQA